MWERPGVRMQRRAFKTFQSICTVTETCLKMCNSDRYVCFGGELVKMILIFFDFVNLN